MVSRLGDVGIEFYAGGCSTTKACILLDQQRNFVRCSVDSKLLTAPETDLVLASAPEVLNRKSDIIGSAKVRGATKVWKEGRAVDLANKKVSVWQVPPGLDATKVLLANVLHVISTIFKDYFFYEM